MRPPHAAALRYQQEALVRVSRTFALAIPELPHPLRDAVANAYLLCRLADTIEDDPDLDATAKARCMAEFLQVVEGAADAAEFAHRLGRVLSPRLTPGELDLAHHTATVLAVTTHLPADTRGAIGRCLGIMSRGMREFQRQASPEGLASLQDLQRYCYCVAGVVGELLTDLFCRQCPELAGRRAHLMALAVGFGQGLQLTNILKDRWEDRQRGINWLPRAGLPRGSRASGAALHDPDPGAHGAGIDALIGIAHEHLQAALDYTQLIPKAERGIRRFCLQTIALALLTLRNVHRRPGYTSAAEVKISRRTVRLAIAGIRVAAASNRLQRLLFALLGRRLPRRKATGRRGQAGAWQPSDGMS
jgi:farnesyl-diphosphate farnesyltransferase